MIENVVETWHRFLAGKLPETLDGLLADDVVFYSPIVYTPSAARTLLRCTSMRPPRRCQVIPSTARFTTRSRSSPAT